MTYLNLLDEYDCTVSINPMAVAYVQEMPDRTTRIYLTGVSAPVYVKSSIDMVVALLNTALKG